MMRKLTTMSIVVMFGLASPGCGEPPEADQSETSRSALGGFPIGSWIVTGGVALQDAPALAKTPFGFATMTGFGLATNSPPFANQIVVGKQNLNGQWNQNWTQVSNNGGAFTSRPSAAAFAVPTESPLFSKFAIVARRADNMYYITIRDQNGAGTVQDWSAIPAGTFSSAPAITFVPQDSLTGPKRTLVLVGLGGDGVVYEARNTLSADNNYFHQAWTGFAPIHTAAFVGSPAISYACPTASSNTSLIVAAAVTEQGNINRFRATKWDGTSWSPWADLPNGLFFGSPALASRTGCSDGITETATFGRGLDGHIWWSTVLSGGSIAWTSIPANGFEGSPQAAGTASQVHVSAIHFGGSGRSNKTSSP